MFTYIEYAAYFHCYVNVNWFSAKLPGYLERLPATEVRCIVSIPKYVGTLLYLYSPTGLCTIILLIILLFFERLHLFMNLFLSSSNIFILDLLFSILVISFSSLICSSLFLLQFSYGYRFPIFFYTVFVFKLFAMMLQMFTGSQFLKIFSNI